MCVNLQVVILLEGLPFSIRNHLNNDFYPGNVGDAVLEDPSVWLKCLEFSLVLKAPETWRDQVIR